MFLSKINRKLLRSLLIILLVVMLLLLAAYFFLNIEHDSISSRRVGGMKLREISQKYVARMGVCAVKKLDKKSCFGDEFVHDNVLIFQSGEHEVVAIDFSQKMTIIQIKNQDLWRCYVPKNSFPIVGCDFLE